jgi:hypothetical protein
MKKTELGVQDASKRELKGRSGRDYFSRPLWMNLLNTLLPTISHFRRILYPDRVESAMVSKSGFR